MKKLLKPASLFFNILALLTFFLIGLVFAGVIEAGKGQMLAAGAIVLSYGFIFAVVAFIASFFLAYKLQHKIIVRLNILLAVIFLAKIGYFQNNYKKRQKAKAQENKETHAQPTKPVDNKLLSMSTISDFREGIQKKNMGVGFFAPNFSENSVLYFYGNPNLEKSVNDHVPTDSIVFDRLEYGGFTIAQAPPWLMPIHIKLDYDILYFKVQAVGKEFLEVTINTQKEQIAYVNKYAGQMIYWPEFWLRVHSIELQNNTNQKVKARPLENAGEVNTHHSFLKPLMVKEEWMQVELLDDNFNSLGKGWVRWKKEGQLLINYSLLS